MQFDFRFSATDEFSRKVWSFGCSFADLLTPLILSLYLFLAETHCFEVDLFSKFQAEGRKRITKDKIGWHVWKQRKEFCEKFVQSKTSVGCFHTCAHSTKGHGRSHTKWWRSSIWSLVQIFERSISRRRPAIPNLGEIFRFYIQSTLSKENKLHVWCNVGVAIQKLDWIKNIADVTWNKSRKFLNVLLEKRERYVSRQRFGRVKVIQVRRMFTLSVSDAGIIGEKTEFS